MSTENLLTTEQLKAHLKHLEVEAAEADKKAKLTHVQLLNLQADLADQEKFDSDLEALIKKYHEERQGIRKTREEQEAAYQSFQKVIHSQLSQRALEAVDKYREELGHLEQRLKTANTKQEGEKKELDAATKEKTKAEDALSKLMGYAEAMQAGLDKATAAGKQIMQDIQSCKPLEAFVALVQPALDNPNLQLADVIRQILPEVLTPQELKAELARKRDVYRNRNEEVREKQQAFDATGEHIQELTDKLTKLKADPIKHIAEIERHLPRVEPVVEAKETRRKA